MSIFHKNWKISFWTHWDTFTLKTPQVFFSKISTESLFKLDETVTSCKKLENFYGWFWKKNSGRTDKQTYEQKNRDYFIGPSFHGYKKYLRIDELKFVKDLQTSDHDTSIFFQDCLLQVLLHLSLNTIIEYFVSDTVTCQ